MPAPADTGIALADASASPLLSRGSSRSPSPAPTDASSSGLGELAISGLPVNGKGRDKASSFSRAMRAAAPRPVRRCLRRCPNPISCRAVLRAVAVFVVGLAVLSFFISLPPTDEINKPPERVVTDFTCPAPAKEKNHAPAPASEPQRRPSDAILPLDTVPKMASNAAPPKYLILLSEKDERLDFVNNFHGSLLSSGAGRDSLVIVYSLDPSNAFLQLLNYYRNAHGMRIEVRRGDLSGGRKLELERFIWYREAIEEWSDVEMFMMCDYDVVFQRHPFLDYPTPVNGISLSSEWSAFAIGDCSHHREWILCGEPWWGVGTMESLKPYPRICAGMIVGYSSALKELLAMLSGEIEKTGCNDQGILNYLYYTCKISHLNVTVHSNELGMGATVGSNPHYWSNSFGELVNQRGQVQAWVHQYKWHPAVIDAYSRKWPLPRNVGRFSVTCRTRVWLWCWDSGERAWRWTDGRGWLALYRWENWMLRNLVRRFSMYRF